jgi:hypothetical protein
MDPDTLYVRLVSQGIWETERSIVKHRKTCFGRKTKENLSETGKNRDSEVVYMKGKLKVILQQPFQGRSPFLFMNLGFNY